MKPAIILVATLFFSLPSNAQNCIEEKISRTLDFEVTRKSLDEKELGQTEITILITKKEGKSKSQIIKFKSEFLSKASFKDCSNNFPNFTGRGSNLELVENDFGDLIVTDLNFDGVEDLAIKREEGGNGGPIYGFYIQTPDGKFVFNNFLSEEMMFFPIEIDSDKRVLRTYIRMDSSQEESIFYQYIESEKSWNIIERRKYRN